MVQREGERPHIHAQAETHILVARGKNPTRDPILCQRRIGLVPKADERSQITKPGLTLTPVRVPQ